MLKAVLTPTQKYLEKVSGLGEHGWKERHTCTVRPPKDRQLLSPGGRIHRLLHLGRRETHE